MSIKSGGTEKPPQDTHLISDHDNHGDAVTWCQKQFVSTTEQFAEATCETCLKVIGIYGQGAVTRLQHLDSKRHPEAANDEGRNKLWLWFELSYASFLTLPRVLMHEMPDAWQSQMADLLTQYNETFPNRPDIGTRVQITDLSGKLIPCPPWLVNYRHPDKETIATLRNEGSPAS